MYVSLPYIASNVGTAGVHSMTRGRKDGRMNFPHTGHAGNLGEGAPFLEEPFFFVVGRS